MATNRTFPAWPEEESTAAPHPSSIFVVGATPACALRRRPRIRRIAVMRDIGPHVALYYIAGGLLGFFGTILFFSLLALLNIIFSALSAFF
ncbi:MAG: hypothetical protein WAU00_23970 [Caldilinea sp.]|uniref:hypothetical protein n=1 Tax=Caldilinea sp. TaxID=2293560 RepID=UPI002B524333|nr:hypothetical protein [Anaerolineales bacterium]HQY92395.1 hypothetical protein [Caldilinea sp.]